MSLLEINWHPSKKDLTWFSLFGLGITLLVATLLYTVKGWSATGCLSLAGVGLIIGISRWVSLTLTRWLYCALVGATLPLGFVMSFALLAVFFYGLLTPVALLFRLIGRDPLNRRFDPKASTYWLTHHQTTEKDRYFQQF